MRLFCAPPLHPIALTRPDLDHINVVRHSNVARFDAIRTNDFLCGPPDGTSIDRARHHRNSRRLPSDRNAALARRVF
jgi:hypothetical protein